MRLNIRQILQWFGKDFPGKTTSHHAGNSWRVAVTSSCVRQIQLIWRDFYGFNYQAYPNRARPVS